MPDPRINCTCEWCGVEFSLIKKSISRKKHTKSPYLCKSCQLEYHRKIQLERRANMSDEEKERLSQISKDLWANKSEEEKQKIINKRSKTLQDNPEIRLAKNAKISKANKEYFNNLSEEERIKRNEKFKLAQNNVSDEEKERRVLRGKEFYKRYYGNISDEEYQAIQNKKRETWANKSEENMQEYRNKISEISKNSWANQTEERKQEIGEKRSIGVKRSWDQRTIEEFEEWAKNVSNGILKGNGRPVQEIENDFMGLLNSNNIKYEFQYMSKIKYDKFDKIFPSNPVTGGKFVSPYHVWDFIIHLRDKSILVDIDGSIHDPRQTDYEVSWNGATFKLSDYIAFNDSQRILQNDGLDVYIIRCFDDKITDESLVINLKTNTGIKFKDFLNTLILDSLPENDVKDLIKLSFKK